MAVTFITDADKKELKELIETKAQKATTLEGYGIEDAYTKEQADEKFQGKLTDKQLGNIADVPNKQDKLSQEQLNNIADVPNKATKATTLQGYGITDAYTKGQADGKFQTKLTATQLQNIEDVSKKADASKVKTLEEDVESLEKNKADFSNVLKGSAIGQSVNLTDVSPVEHTLDVKVKIKNIVSVVQTVGDISSVTGEPNGAVVNAACNTPMYKGKRYTMSWDTENTGATVWITFVSNYRKTISHSPNHDKCDGTRKWVVFEMHTDCLVPQGWALQASSKNTVNTGRCDNFMIEEGEVATEYAPYMADVSDVWVEVTDDSGRHEENLPTDGTLEVNSSYPSMSIRAMNDGAVVDVTYNRDINKAFAELQTLMTSAIVSLGGDG